jgi:hypothetical protein
MACAPTSEGLGDEGHRQADADSQAASTMSHITMCPPKGYAAMCGHSGNSAMVMPRARMARAGLTTPPMPGMGTKTKTPATRPASEGSPEELRWKRAGHRP